MLEQKNKPTVFNGVRQARESRGLTEPQLADLVQVQPATIVAIEEGEYAPSISLSLRLAWALGYPVEQLFWLSPQPLRANTVGVGGDEWYQALGSKAAGHAAVLLIVGLYVYMILEELTHLPRIIHPVLAFIFLFLIVNVLSWFLVQEFRVGDRTKRFMATSRVLSGMGIPCYLGYLGYAIGFTMIEILIGLAFLIGAFFWALAIRELWRRRHPVAYRTNAGYG